MPNSSKKIALARKFRKALTEPEFLLWERLKIRIDGLIFKRQHAIGPYIVDFYCFRAKLVVEVDGVIHSEDERAVRDAIRETWLTQQGLMVYRIPAADVYRDADAVADGVRLLALGRMETGK